MLSKIYVLAYDLLVAIPFARLIYTLVLFALIFALGRELFSVWDRGKIFLSDFAYFDTGTKKPEYAEQVRNETILNYGLILRLIKRYPPSIEVEDHKTDGGDQGWRYFTSMVERAFKQSTGAVKRRMALWIGYLSGKGQTNDNSDEDNTADSRKGPIVNANVDKILQNLQIEKLDQVAGQLDITVQGVSLKALFSAFGNLVYPKNTNITASIYVTNEKQRRAIISISGAAAAEHRQGLADDVPRVLRIDAGADDAENAFRIACFLVWAQWSNQSDQSSPQAPQRASFEEFCNWAKILNNKDILTSAEAYQLNAKKKEINLTFLREQFALAAQLDVGMHEIYASLAGLERFIGDDKIMLSERSETTVDSLADIIRYLAFTKGISQDQTGDGQAWTKYLPDKIVGKAQINSLFFKSAIHTDCDTDIDNNALKAAKRVVRIKRTIPLRRTNRTVDLITTGVIVDKNHILSVLPGGTDIRGLATFANADVALVACNQPSASFKVEKAESAGPSDSSPFVILTTPDLPTRDDPLAFVFNGLATDFDQQFFDDFTIAGHIRNTDLIFATRKELRDSDTGVVNNDSVHLIRARSVAIYNDEFADDRERRFYLSAPFGAGLTGAPIVNDFGNIIGLVEGGTFLGQNLSLAIGISASSLKRNPLFAPLAKKN